MPAAKRSTHTGHALSVPRIGQGVMLDDPLGDPRDRVDSLRIAGWIAGITLVLMLVLGLLAYTDIWLF